MSTPSRRPLRVLTAALVVLALTATIAACGDDDKKSDTGSSTTAASTNSPDKITIGYQAIPNGDLIVKHNTWLETAFPDAQIEWKLFDSGGSVNEAVAADSIDFGLAGSSPVSRGIRPRSPTRCRGSSTSSARPRRSS